jgi:hypothetical protein
MRRFNALYRQGVAIFVFRVIDSRLRNQDHDQRENNQNGADHGRD